MNEIGLSLDTVWMLLAAMLVFWMQPGFALCEAGRLHVWLIVVLLPRLRLYVWRRCARWFYWRTQLG